MSSAISQQQVQSQPFITKRAKKIQKKEKKGEKVCQKRPANSHNLHQLKDVDSKLKSRSSKMYQKQADYWLKDTSAWLISDPSKGKMCIEEQINEMPILESVEQLFSLSTKKRLSNETSQNSFNRYCKMVSFADKVHNQNILLKGQQASAICHTGIGRHGVPIANSILMLSPEQLQTIEKRVSFMEKLKGNESKYDASITKMTNISKELAFTYRMYLQKRNQLCDSLKEYSANLPFQEEQLQNPSEQYTRLLIKKNLIHAFHRGQVQPMNYFKLKHSSESNRFQQYSVIQTIEGYKQYITKKKPKKVSKFVLATACSVCFSDYYEWNNPFRHCSVCKLRAHQRCYSFQHSKCGYCAYQKIQRHLKEQVSWCFICKQSGMLTVKFNNREYAHGFCLLIHGLWRVSNGSKFTRSCLQTVEEMQCISSDYFLQTKFRINSKSIQFINPHQNLASCSIPAIDSSIFGMNEGNSPAIQSEGNSSSLRNIGVIQQRQQIEDWQKRNENSREIKDDHQKCGCCHQQFYKNYFLTCETCAQTYHASCAFLSGFDLKLSQYKWNNTNSQNCVQLNCCCQSASKIAWSRKYKLNYKKTAFEIEETRHYIEQSINRKENQELLLNF